MTLPTVQPVDWPDWSALPTQSASVYSLAGVVGPGEILASVDVGYFSHTLIVFDGNTVVSDWVATLRWKTASPSEGGSIAWDQETIIMAGHIVVVPMTSGAPYLEIISSAALVYPHDAAFTVTLFSQWGSMVGWPGGIFAVNESQTVAGGDDLVMAPIGCGPGAHHVNIATDGAVWTLTLRTWHDVSTPIDTLLADETTVAPYNIEFHPPASSWSLLYHNGDAGDNTPTIFVTRAPTG